MSLAAVGPTLTAHDSIQRLRALHPDDLDRRVETHRERESLAVLMARIRPLLLSAIHTWTREPHAVEDAIQETYLRALQGLPGFRGDSKVSTWLYGIAYNVARNHQRRTSRLVTGADEHVLDQRASPGTGGEAACCDPEQTAIRQERRAMLHEALAKLPVHYRQVIELRDLQELSGQESAARIGITPANVRVRLHRARKRLARLLSARMERMV